MWYLWDASVLDNGGGMDPDKMRQCMSLGYSAKSKVANTIGQCKPSIIWKRCIHFIFLFCSFLNCLCCCYSDGNGFKTSTMRLGADVIVFSRCPGKDGKRFDLCFSL
jgi:hypothetical protein